MPSILQDAAADGTQGGGAGGGAGAGTGDTSPGAVTIDSVKKLIDDSINGFAKRFKTDISKDFGGLLDPLKLALEALKPLPAPDLTKKDGEGKGGDPEVNARLLESQKQISKLTQQVTELRDSGEKAKRDAEQTDRHAKIRTILSTYQFANTEALEAAFRMFAAEIARSGDGFDAPLVAGDLTADAYIKDKLTRPEYAFYLAPKDAGGAGAAGGKVRGSGSFDINDIKPGMTQEQIAQAAAAIKRARG